MTDYWKGWERWVATFFGGTRAGPTGKTGSDISGVPGLAIECKARNRLPIWVRDAGRPGVVTSVTIAPKGGIPTQEDEFVVMNIVLFRELWTDGRLAEFPVSRSSLVKWAGWIVQAMNQSAGAAKPGELPIVVLHQKHRKNESGIVVVRWNDIYGGMA